jgi:hypothetical protein
MCHGALAESPAAAAPALRRRAAALAACRVLEQYVKHGKHGKGSRRLTTHQQRAVDKVRPWFGARSGG